MVARAAGQSRGRRFAAISSQEPKPWGKRQSRLAADVEGITIR